MTTKTLRAEAADRIGQLETALAKCRDAMPEQTDKAIDALMIESIASPDAVPAYVKAVAVQLEREKAEFQHAAGTMQIAIDGLQRENAALETRLQEIQRMCLGYQEEHAGLRKDAERVDFYSANTHRVIQVLDTWYHRKDYGMMVRKAQSLRAAIDAAMMERT